MFSKGKKGTTFAVKIVYSISVVSLDKWPYADVLESKKKHLSFAKTALNFHTKKEHF